MISHNEIRILYLLPHNGDNESLLKGDLKVVALEKDPEYDAISYVWGNSESLIDVEISGHTVGVTKNLHSLLQRLRLADRTRPLWIDQLCINQWDLKEKAQQVRLMRQIYSKCQTCQIWMGEFNQGIPQADAEEAVEILKYMAAVFEAGGKEEGIALPSSFESDESFKGPLKALESLGMHTTPWWSRVWTVQEAVLPPQQTILWGSTTFPWKTLTHATRTWTGGIPSLLYERLTPSFSTPTLADLMAMAIWVDSARGSDDNPAFVINRYRNRRATDPRDKAYALMGLLPAGSLPTVEDCDYDRPAVDVFCDLSFGLMVNDESLFPLIMDPRLEGEAATPGMPRWALDAAYISEHNTDWFHMFAWPEYQAHGGRHLNIGQLLKRREISRYTLELKGVFVDTIETVGEVWLSPRPPGSDYNTDQRALIKEWERIAKEHIQRLNPDTYLGGLSFREAFGRLMLGNLLRNEEQRVEAPADDEDVETVYKYLERGEQYWTHRTIKGMMTNQRIFLTKTGLMGIGHINTQPGEEVWVFHGGNFPFTVNGREGGGDDYDFGGLCYVQGIMSGEAFERGEETRTVTIY
ncbi:heterokaryon incompatibility protein-domain-containing protein [Dactylonectria estremocensis]|uniref:Heterokaryon incompatibility protein-domain-containing protein n=1 Tax=Dactylonectria estremocensis TaxID=1079267 RepID=A0A9P9EBP2_9HYPO|nr:heterokaryon incompatibility protein-domain-containing protein [Dactylonectria estremocensis]